MIDKLSEGLQHRFGLAFERLSAMSAEQEISSLQREARSVAADISELSLEMSTPNQYLDSGKWTVVSDFLAVLEFTNANGITLKDLSYVLNQDGRISSIMSRTNTLVSTEGLHALPHLVGLMLQDVGSLECDHLISLSQLETLNLNYSKPNNFKFLNSLTNLRVFEALKTGMRDLNLIKHLSLLEELSVGGNGITTIVPLVHLRNLRKLFLISEDVGDLSPLAEMQGLTDLQLFSLDEQDLSIVLRLPNLLRISLSKAMTAHSREQGCLEMLREKGVVVELV